MRFLTILLIVSSVAFGDSISDSSNGPQNQASSSCQAGEKFADISRSIQTDNLKVNLKYATPNNFMGQAAYNKIGLNRAYLHKECIPKLKQAADKLAKLRPDLNLVVYDSARPIAAQKAMWESIMSRPGMTENEAQNYVSKPSEDESKVSMHNLGLAVDIALETKNHDPLDMGTAFDTFGPRSHRDTKELSSDQKGNRAILDKVMTESGFDPLRTEWWHFNCIKRADANADRSGLRMYPVVKCN